MCCLLQTKKLASKCSSQGSSASSGSKSMSKLSQQHQQSSGSTFTSSPEVAQVTKYTSRPNKCIKCISFNYDLLWKVTLESDKQVLEITSLPDDNSSPGMQSVSCFVTENIKLLTDTWNLTCVKEHLLARRKKVYLTLQDLRCVYTGNWLNDQVNILIQLTMLYKAYVQWCIVDNRWIPYPTWAFCVCFLSCCGCNCNVNGVLCNSWT